MVVDRPLTAFSASAIASYSSIDYSGIGGALKLAECTNARVRVRVKPDLEAGTAGYLANGDKLEVLDKSA